MKKIDNVLIGDTYRKRFSIDNSSAVWIEGIDNLKELLFTSGETPANGMNGNLIC